MDGVGIVLQEFEEVVWWYEGFPGGASGKEPACQCRRQKSHGFDPWVGHGNPGVGHSNPGVGHGNPLQYSCLENPMDRGAWQTKVHGVAESDMTEATWQTLMVV